MTPASIDLAETRVAAEFSRGRFACLAGAAALLVVLDQGVKWAIAATLALGEVITVTPWFNVVHVLNPGASFSLLADAGGWQRHALTAIGIAVSVTLAVMLWRGVRSRLETAAYVGLIGGGLGNVVDRIRIGAVVDYLDLHWRGAHWPAFNLADVFIVSSAALLILSSFALGSGSPVRLDGGAGRDGGH